MTSHESERAADRDHLRYLLTAYVFDNISDDGRREVEAHLEDCADCRAEFEALRSTAEILEDGLSGGAPEEGGDGDEDAEGAAAGERPSGRVDSFEERRLQRVLEASRRRPSRRRAWLVASAAAVVILGLSVSLVTFSLQSAGKDRRLASRFGALPSDRMEMYHEVADREDADYLKSPGESSVALRDNTLSLEVAQEGRVHVYGTSITDAHAARRADGETRAGGATVSRSGRRRHLDGPALATTAPSPLSPAAEAAGDDASAAVAEAGRAGAAREEPPKAVTFYAQREAPEVRKARPSKAAGAKTEIPRGTDLEKLSNFSVVARGATSGKEPPIVEHSVTRTRNKRARSGESRSPDTWARLNERQPRDGLQIGGGVRNGKLSQGLVELAKRKAEAGDSSEAGAAFGFQYGAKVAREPEARWRLGGPQGPAQRATQTPGVDGIRDTFDDRILLAGGAETRDETPRTGTADRAGATRDYGEDEETAAEAAVPTAEVLLPPAADRWAGRVSAGSTATAAPGGAQAEAKTERELLREKRAAGEHDANKEEAEVADATPAVPHFVRGDSGDGVAAGEGARTLGVEKKGYGSAAGGEIADFRDIREITATAEKQLRSREPDIEISGFQEFEGLVDVWGLPGAGGGVGGGGGKALYEALHDEAFYGVDSTHDVDLRSASRGHLVPKAGDVPLLGMLFKGAAKNEADGRRQLLSGLAAREVPLRAFSYYRKLDPELSLERFRARPMAIAPPTVGDEGLGREAFRERHGVNPFVATRVDPFSTFGLDVDTASFSLARNYLRSGKLPPPESVRVEEFVNSFPEEVRVDPSKVFSVLSEGGPSPFGRGLDLLKITVKSRELRPNERKDCVLTFAVDTSGSMALGGRLGLVRQALDVLVKSLLPGDRVAIVAFGANSYVALPQTSVRERERILSAIESLSPTGGTNVEAGLELAYRLADESLQPRALNRVVLCSDGVANVGARGPDEILRKVKVYARRGIYLTAVGFGKKKYRDEMLQRLADEGNGNYAYVDRLDQATRIFRSALPATLQVLAEDAKIQVHFDPEAVSHYRLLGYEKRDVADEDFRNDRVDAGEVGPGTTVTVLYEILRRRAAAGNLGKVFLRYRDTGTRRVEEVDFDIPPGVLATRLDETTDRFRFIACVAELAELLRHSYYARDGSFGSVLRLLESVSPEYRERSDWKAVAELARRAQLRTVLDLAKTARK